MPVHVLPSKKSCNAFGIYRSVVRRILNSAYFAISMQWWMWESAPIGFAPVEAISKDAGNIWGCDAEGAGTEYENLFVIRLFLGNPGGSGIDSETVMWYGTPKFCSFLENARSLWQLDSSEIIIRFALLQREQDLITICERTDDMGRCGSFVTWSILEDLVCFWWISIANSNFLNGRCKWPFQNNRLSSPKASTDLDRI
jgi:hypothetical protein